MRLYKLISRHGQVKERLWPWFEPPAAGAPMRYVGWVWNPAIGEWVRTDIEPITVEVSAPRYPKPTMYPRPHQSRNVPGWYFNEITKRWEERSLTLRQRKRGLYRGPEPEWPPGPYVPTEVEGWSWDSMTRKWVATIVIGMPIEFDPPRSLPPGITQATVFELYSFEQLFIEEVTYFVNQGYTLEAARQITRANFDNLIRMMYAQERAGTTHGWQDLFAKISGHEKIVIQELTVIAVLALVAGAVGYLIGTILGGLITPRVEDFVLKEKRGTYLLGPGNWVYSKHIGTSVKGQTFYSHCEDIGTEYVRHKRQPGKRGFDVIDFPGGFVETGYQFPYFVKYTWSHWVLQYVGMLESRGSRFYVLKKADYDRFAGLHRGRMLEPDDWCKDFHWYL